MRLTKSTTSRPSCAAAPNRPTREAEQPAPRHTEPPPVTATDAPQETCRDGDVPHIGHDCDTDEKDNGVCEWSKRIRVPVGEAHRETLNDREYWFNCRRH